MKPFQHYHEPRTVHELTARNVETIVELEASSQKHRTLGDRAADKISAFCGSITFVWVHLVWFTLWLLWNAGATGLKPFDPFPFNFLTLIVSLEAIFLSTFILVSENRQARVSERRSHLDLQINLLSEQENTKMLQLLREIAVKVGVDPSNHPDISVLEQATRPEALVAQIEESVEKSHEQSGV
jgi:uncharacterized membrane protein